MIKFIAMMSLFVSFSALACKCYPDYRTKDYQNFQKTWYGKKANFTCKYDCRSGGYKETVKGSHSVKVIGDEKGNEIVCDGTIYKEIYNSHVQWFVYHYEGSQWFNPKKSKSKELNEWAERHCR